MLAGRLWAMTSTGTTHQCQRAPKHCSWRCSHRVGVATYNLLLQHKLYPLPCPVVPPFVLQSWGFTVIGPSFIRACRVIKRELLSCFKLRVSVWTPAGCVDQSIWEPGQAHSVLHGCRYRCSPGHGPCCLVGGHPAGCCPRLEPLRREHVVGVRA